MKEHPILYSGPMVRAILAGRKTQTRRMAKFTAGGHLKEPRGHRRWHRDDPNAVFACPYGQPGDRLWVRETFCLDADDNGMTAFRADNWLECPSADGKWKPSIFMERRQSRITLEIVSIRVERLQAINEADACAEGVSEIKTQELGSDNVIRPLTISAVKCYRSLWNHINGFGSGSWEANPWVWVLEFRRLPAGVQA